MPFFILWPELRFWNRISGPHFRPAFQARILGPHLRPAFQARISGPHLRPAFQATVSWATAQCSRCQLGCSGSQNFPCNLGSCYRSILSEIGVGCLDPNTLRETFLEIAWQNWPFKIGLSLFDFKQLLVGSGSIVHCKSGLNTFEARLVYTTIPNHPVRNKNMTFGGTVCLSDFSIHRCCFLGRQPLLHVSGDALPSAPTAQSVPWKENQDGDQLHWAI